MMCRGLLLACIAAAHCHSMGCSPLPAPRLSPALAAPEVCGEPVAAELATLTLSHGNVYDQRRVILDASGRASLHHRRMANGPGPLFTLRERRCIAPETLRPILARFSELLRAPQRPPAPATVESSLCLEQWTWSDGRTESPPAPGRCFDVAAAAPVIAALPIFEPNHAATCPDGTRVCGLKIESGSTPHPHERYTQLFDSVLLSADGAWWCLHPMGAGGEYEVVRGRLPRVHAAAALNFLLDGLTIESRRGDASHHDVGTDYQAAWMLRPDGRASLTASQTALVRQRFAHLAAQLSPACALH